MSWCRVTIAFLLTLVASRAVAQPLYGPNPSGHITAYPNTWQDVCEDLYITIGKSAKRGRCDLDRDVNELLQVNPQFCIFDEGLGLW